MTLTRRAGRRGTSVPMPISLLAILVVVAACATPAGGPGGSGPVLTGDGTQLPQDRLHRQVELSGNLPRPDAFARQPIDLSTLRTPPLLVDPIGVGLALFVALGLLLPAPVNWREQPPGPEGGRGS